MVGGEGATEWFLGAKRMRQSTSLRDSGEVDTERGTGGPVVSIAQTVRERREVGTRGALTRQAPSCLLSQRASLVVREPLGSPKLAAWSPKHLYTRASLHHHHPNTYCRTLSKLLDLTPTRLICCQSHHGHCARQRSEEQCA
jgi:hypothetical protein